MCGYKPKSSELINVLPNMMILTDEKLKCSEARNYSIPAPKNGSNYLQHCLSAAVQSWNDGQAVLSGSKLTTDFIAGIAAKALVHLTDKPWPVRRFHKPAGVSMAEVLACHPQLAAEVPACSSVPASAAAAAPPPAPAVPPAPQSAPEITSLPVMPAPAAPASAAAAAQQPASVQVKCSSKTMPGGILGSMDLARVRAGKPPSSAECITPADAPGQLITAAAFEVRAGSKNKKAKKSVKLQFASGVKEFGTWLKEQGLDK